MLSTALKGYVKMEREKATAKGEARGKAEGILLDKQETLIRQMTRKFGIGETEAARINSCTDRDKLTAALDAILDAATADEVLRELD